MAHFVAGDWGTTSGRFWLCNAAGEAIDGRGGPGVAAIANPDGFAAAFEAACDGWPLVPAILCGTIGSNIGWRNVGYQSTPIVLADLAHGAIRFAHRGRDIAILSGVKCRNAFGEQDIMRGEETQIAGACALQSLTDGLFMLPGTHNKWVSVANGRIERFHTAMSGELYAALVAGTILVPKGAAAASIGPAFDQGAQLALQHDGANLLEYLFTTRVRCVDGRLGAADAASFLSGLVIGADIAGALPHVDRSAVVHMICSDELALCYGRALELAGRRAARLSGTECALRGLDIARHALRL